MNAEGLQPKSAAPVNKAGRPSRAEVGRYVLQAQQGEADAWHALTVGLGDLVWSIVRSFRLSDADAHDAAQMTWLRAVEKIETVREPERFGLWLATTARRECMRCIQQRSRVQSVDPQLNSVIDLTSGDFAESVTDRDLGERAVAAISALNDECQHLLRMVLADPPFSYAEIAECLDIAVGTIGPRRKRCLSRLRSAIRN